jgi:hypothetical protein
MTFFYSLSKTRIGGGGTGGRTAASRREAGMGGVDALRMEGLQFYSLNVFSARSIKYDTQLSGVLRGVIREVL